MIKVCSKCNNMFEDYFDKYNMCPNCRDDEENLLRQIKDYLWDNPGTTEKKLKELFDVSHNQLMEWLREERLEITPDSDIVLRCERCGSMIFTGKYCEDCNNKIKTTVNEINNSMNKDKEEKKIRVMSINRAKLKESKMRFMKSDK
ncbi:MAG: hypothetical protein K6F41_08665 [Lachnospira sp.]|nr:hypothetical protein [Lachnospira sp.]